MAHDEKNECRVGDTVRIEETRPLSARKRWRVLDVISRGDAGRSRAGGGSMIGMRTILQVADNSGARKLSCILPLGGDVGLQAGLG